MMDRVEIERENLRNVLVGIREKDERKNNSVISVEVYGKRSKINNRLTAGCGVDSIRAIRNDMLKYYSDMKDYSNFSSDKMVEVIREMLDKKGYKNAEVSRMMNMSDSGVSGAMSQKTRVTLINIYEFVCNLMHKNVLAAQRTEQGTLEITKTDEDVRKKEVKELNEEVNSLGKKIVAKIGKMYVMELEYNLGEENIRVASLKLTGNINYARRFLPIVSITNKERLVDQLGIKFVEVKEVTTIVEEEVL